MHSNNTVSSSDTYANDRADNHINMMQSNRKAISKPLFTDAEMIEIDNALKEGWGGKSDDTPLQTKAINEAKQARIDLIRQVLTTIAVFILVITIYNITGAQ